MLLDVLDDEFEELLELLDDVEDDELFVELVLLDERLSVTARSDQLVPSETCNSPVLLL